MAECLDETEVDIKAKIGIEYVLDSVIITFRYDKIILIATKNLFADIL